MLKVLTKSPGLKEQATHYCPGCTHGIIHRLVAETLAELDVLGSTIGCASVGCSILSYNYLNVDMIESAHGRAPAVATGVKRVHPDKDFIAHLEIHLKKLLPPDSRLIWITFTECGRPVVAGQGYRIEPLRPGKPINFEASGGCGLGGNTPIIPEVQASLDNFSCNYAGGYLSETRPKEG